MNAAVLGHALKYVRILSAATDADVTLDT